MRVHHKHRGFSLIELLVVIAVVAVLAAILVPVANSVLTNARQAKGAEQLRQIGIALQCYSQEHNQSYPPVAVDNVPWDREALAAYLTNYSAAGSPSFDGGGNAESIDEWKVRRAYSAGGAMFGVTQWNQAINTSKSRPVLSIQNASDAVLVFDARVTWHGLCRDGTDWSRITVDIQNANLSGNKYIDYRHNGRAQFLFADMHVEAMAPEAVLGRFGSDRKIYEGL